MRRALANIFAAITFTLGVCLFALCVRSLYHLDSLYFEWGGRGYFLSTVRGELGAIQTARPFGIATWNFGHYNQAEREPVSVLETALSDDATHRWGVIRFGSGIVNPTSQFMGSLDWLAVPLPLPGALLALPAAIRVRRRMRNRSRARRHLCLVCGYDIRATPDRCSECGASAILHGRPASV